MVWGEGQSYFGFESASSACWREQEGRSQRAVEKEAKSGPGIRDGGQTAQAGASCERAEKEGRSGDWRLRKSHEGGERRGRTGAEPRGRSGQESFRKDGGGGRCLRK